MKIRGFCSILVAPVIYLVITPVFVESFGSTLLGEENKSKSRTLYLFISAASQLVYYFFSGFNEGFISMPCMEAKGLAEQIMANSYTFSSKNKLSAKTDLTNEYTVYEPLNLTNPMCCFVISSLVVFICSRILYSIKAGKYIKMLPKPVTYSMMLCNGLLMILMGCHRLYVPSEKMYSLLFMTISTVISAIGICILKRYMEPVYLVCYIFLITAVMNILKLYFGEFMYHHLLFSPENVTALSIRKLVNTIDVKSISVKFIFSNLANIISIAMLAVLNNLIAIPLYADKIEANIDIDREIRAFGFSNLSLLFPSNLNYSGSLLFYISGGSTRSHSLLAGCLIIPLFFFLHHICSYLPTFIPTFIIQFIGISFFVEYAIEFVKLSSLDKFVVFVTFSIGVCFQGQIIYILLAGLLFTFSLNFAYINKGSLIESGTTIQIVKVVNYTNVHNLIEMIRKKRMIFSRDECITLDFTECDYVDMTANILLKEYLHKERIAFQTIGESRNLYDSLKAGIKNKI